MYLCAAASVAILVLLWAPSFSATAGQLAMTYAIAPLAWTAVALVIAAIGLVLGWLVPGQPAAQVAVATLLLAVCIVFWSSMPSEETSASIELAAVIAASLLPPILFGWLIGYGYRTRHAGFGPPHES
jgi:hypothetical protein